MDHVGRQRRLQRILSEQRLDALLITHLPNILYLCGFTGSSGVLGVAPKQVVFFTDGRYTEQSHSEVSEARVVIARKPPLVAAAEWLARKKTGSRKLQVGLEGEHL